MKGRKALWGPFRSQWAHHWCCFRSRLCPCFAWTLTIGPRCNWSGHLWTVHQISCSYQLQHHIFPPDSPPWRLCVYGPTMEKQKVFQDTSYHNFRFARQILQNTRCSLHVGTGGFFEAHPERMVFLRASFPDTLGVPLTCWSCQAGHW